MRVFLVKTGEVYREQTLATGGEMCDYWIVPDLLKDPQ
jgi:hypothetical protein